MVTTMQLNNTKVFKLHSMLILCTKYFTQTVQAVSLQQQRQSHQDWCLASKFIQSHDFWGFATKHND